MRYQALVPEAICGERCNCSICAKKGAVMVYVPIADLEVTKGSETLTCYSFNTGVAKHHFCPTCGIHVFHQTRSDPTKYGINAATLDGIDPYADFAVINVNDGIHHVRDHGVSRSAGTLRFEKTNTQSEQDE